MVWGEVNNWATLCKYFVTFWPSLRLLCKRRIEWKNHHVVDLSVIVEALSLENVAVDQFVSVKTAHVPQSADVENKSLEIINSREKILAQLQKKGLSRIDAEEVFHSALLQCIESLEQLKSPEKFNSWFRTILRNKTVDYYRERKFELLDDATDNIAQETQELFCRCTYKLLELLKDEYRSTLSERLINHRSVKETAKELDISEGLVKVRTHRAKEEMRVLLKQCCGLESARDAIDCECD
jgi:RNA polymerase sigma-70 factor (ECF subfamily)